jgi:glycerol-3-phosphate cytidylyltransferase
MTSVITYGTFDLFHEGHRRLLERAKALGDHLIVGVTSESYDIRRGKLNVQETLMQRLEHIRNSGLADEILVEEHEGQKISDIQKYRVDIFAIGSDWVGRFDYLEDYCQVSYLSRTSGISSTELRATKRGIVRMGIAGAGRIAGCFVAESKFVSGVNVEGIYTPRKSSAQPFAERHELDFFATNYERMLDRVDGVYIASPHSFHFQQAHQALTLGKHVLCERPLALRPDHAAELFALADDNQCVLLEAIKTAYAPGFRNLVAIARSGSIGAIRAVDATFTKLTSGHPRELQPEMNGGSLSELASYPLLAIAKLLGTAPIDRHVDAFNDLTGRVDLFSRIQLRYASAIASATVALGAKSEGSLVISGTEGYIYVPSPWWKTDYFEVRREDPRLNQRYSDQFDGDGLRYELAEFLNCIGSNERGSYMLTPNESIFIAEMLHEAYAAIVLRPQTRELYAPSLRPP